MFFDRLDKTGDRGGGSTEATRGGVSRKLNVFVNIFVSHLRATYDCFHALRRCGFELGRDCDAQIVAYVLSIVRLRAVIRMKNFDGRRIMNRILDSMY